MDCSPPGSSVREDTPGKNTGVGCHVVLQGVFPTQGLNPGLPRCRQILYQLSYQGSPHKLFSSVTQSCLTLCDPMNRSTPGLPVHHQLPESTQTHAHRIGDAIQPSHPLLSPSPPPPIPPSIRMFSNESTLRVRWPKYWSFSFSISPSNEHPGLINLL